MHGDALAPCRAFRPVLNPRHMRARQVRAWEIEMNLNRVRLGVAWAAMMLALVVAAPASAQGAISSGETLTGTIAPVGDFDTWTFSANTGDAIVVRVGE